MDGVLTLIEERHEQDELGVPRSREICREVFCRVNSVTRSEFFGAGRSDLNPEYQFTVFAGDYNGEAVIRYEGRAYAVYRTYHVPGTDDIELYAERKGGADGKGQNRC